MAKEELVSNKLEIIGLKQELTKARDALNQRDMAQNSKFADQALLQTSLDEKDAKVTYLES